jgi:hypothetical protein
MAERGALRVFLAGAFQPGREIQLHTMIAPAARVRGSPELLLSLSSQN